MFEIVFAADILYMLSKYLFHTICSLVKTETKIGPPQTKSKHDLLVGASSYLNPLIKDGYGLTVTEIKDFVSSLAEIYDPELYSRDSKIRVLDN